MDPLNSDFLRWSAKVALLASLLVAAPSPALAASGDSAASETDTDSSEAPDTDSSETPDGWQVSFSARDLPDGLTDRKLLVVAAGGQREEGRAAADALRRAFDEAGAPLVMDGSNLGDVADRSDQGIVEAASNLPVEAIVIVRVFASGETPNAVVSSYETGGEAITGFDVAKGIGGSGEESSGAGEGVSQETVDAIESATSPDRDDSEVADENLRYELSLGDTWRLDDKKEGASHEGESIYTTLGRPKLADKYRQNRTVKSGLKWGGIGGTVLGLAGTGLGIATIANNTRCPEPDAPGCNPAAAVLGTYLTVGAVNITVAGMAAWIAAGFQDLHPVSASRLRDIAREQNEEMGDDGGGDQADARGADTLAPSAAVSSPAPKVGWSVLPTDDGWQAGLSIRW